MRGPRRRGQTQAADHAPSVAAILLTATWALATACAGNEPQPSRHEVGIRAFQYSPAQLSVAAGDTVVWINEDAVPHTATAGDRAWDTGTIPSKQSGHVVVGRKGEYRYVCEFHPNMSATLIVE